MQTLGTNICGPDNSGAADCKLSKGEANSMPGVLDRANARFVALDFIRFLMAMLVVLFHFEFFIKPNALPDQRWLSGFDAAVDFFFMLSGFVICHSYGNKQWNCAVYLDYIKRRIARIYPLHFATLLLFILAAGLASTLGFTINNTARYDFWDIPAQLFLVHAWGLTDQLSFNHVSWSISAEFFLYLVFPLLVAMVRSGGIEKSLMLFLTVIFMLNLATENLSQPHWLHRSFDLGIIRAVPSFFLGIVLWQIWFRSVLTCRMSWIWPFAAMLTALVLMASEVPREFLLVVFAVSILVTALADFSNGIGGIASKLMKKLGDASYGLYMLHPIIGIAMFKVVAPHISWLNTNPLLAAFLAICLSLVAALMSFEFFETPMRRFLSGRSLPRSNSKSGDVSRTGQIKAAL